MHYFATRACVSFLLHRAECVLDAGCPVAEDKGPKGHAGHLADDAIAPAPAPCAAGAGPQAELAQDDRVAALQDLWVRDARVGHVRVHAGAPVPAGPRACMRGRA